MRIGIDGTTLDIPFPCGVKHYSEQILASLAKIDKKNEYLIFAKKDVNIPRQKNFKLVKIPTFLPILKRQFFITYFARRKRVDLFHCLEVFGPIFLNNLNVLTTVHDLDLDMVYPKPKTPGQHLHRIYAEFIRERNITNTKQLIAVSKNTKKDLKKYLKKRDLDIPIKVIYEAPHKKFKKLEKKGKKEGSYFLAMGDFSPRKNIPMVLTAYSMLPQKIKDKYKLKIVVSTDKPAERFKKETSSLGIEERVKILVSPSLDSLIKLYQGALAFVYPSLYEGFGLPILEAMEAGCPVITSGLGATKEVAGDAAILINPKDKDELSKAMTKVAAKAKLAQKYKKKGFERAKNFSWEKAARETLKVYNKVGNNKK